MAVRQSRFVCKKCWFFDFNWLPWQHPLRYRKKKVGLIICNSRPIICCEDSENWSSRSWDTSAPSEKVRYDTKLVAMATSQGISKTGLDRENSRKYLSFGEKIVKIIPVDTEMALLVVKKRKKEEIKASKIYSPSGKFAEWAKTSTQLMSPHFPSSSCAHH